jgi:hypothetical protein
VVSRIALLGHLNIQTTRGYVAVFDEDIVRHYAAFLDHRRELRSAESGPLVHNGHYVRKTDTSTSPPPCRRGRGNAPHRDRITRSQSPAADLYVVSEYPAA